MNLLVCFKIYSDLTKVKLEDLEIDEEMGVDTHFLPNIINCFDESSLEFAIRLSENYTSINKSALTICKSAANMTLKSLLALGYENVVRIEADEMQIRFNPETVAENIVKYVKKNNQDLILIGKESPLSNNAATAQLVSNKLNYPLISSVIDIKVIDDNIINVKIENNNSIYSQNIKLPCVLSMGNAVISKLRMPTLKERMKNKNRKIEEVDFVESEKTIFNQPISIYKPKRNRQGIIYKIDGDENITAILDKELSKRIIEL
ncbi:MAG: electron transfer flavoprotein subunit beta/FixA family protein [Pleomorphochaeta sp.]